MIFRISIQKNYRILEGEIDEFQLFLFFEFFKSITFLQSILNQAKQTADHMLDFQIFSHPFRS